MSGTLRLLPAGGSALLAETGSLARALALLDLLQADLPEGVTGLIPAAQSVLVQFDPLRLSMADLAARLRRLDLTPGPAQTGRDIQIPVHYDGEDLTEVAALLGLSVADLIARHEAAVFTVAFTGFAPGFAYLQCSDPGLQVPRRQSPRVRIPAGAVAMAGEFGGVYPSDSPGGWQLLGRTPLPMWDLTRPQPALLAPGDRVRFADIARGARVPQATTAKPAAPQAPGPVTLTRADRPVLFQDLGRPGLAGQGVSRAGAMDRGALIAANRALGNPRNTPALEILLGGVALRSEVALTLALSGALCPLSITAADGTKCKADPGQPIALNAGDLLTLGAPTSGLYSYLALRGGWQVASVLGSASRDSLAKLGPEPLTAGDSLTPAGARAQAISPLYQPDLPRPGTVVTLDLLPGPRDDWFTAKGRATLTAQAWTVTPESSRSGKRLTGPEPLERCDSAELPSEGAVPGAIQVPHSGQPVLFLADHPLTGGYPVIAVVAPHHLDLAAQIPPGAQIRFHMLPSPLPKD